MNNVRVFHVLAGAYKSRKSLADALSHACVCNERGYPIKVLCGRVDIDHIMPDYDTGAPPTCPVCLRRTPK